MKALGATAVTVLAISLGLAGCGGSPSGAAGPTPSASRSATAPAGPVTVPADFVAVGSGTTTRTFGAYGIQPTVLPLGAVLAGPHFAVWIDSVSVVNEITPAHQKMFNIPSTSPNSSLLAGPGREFLLARVHERESTANPEKPTEPLGVSIIVDGAAAARKLEAVPGTGSLIVVSVPTGAEALLIVADAGRTQSISLRTGKRQEAIALFYPLLYNQVRLEDLVHIPALNKPGQGFSYQATIRFTLRPWHPDAGWAKPGRAWLVVHFSMQVGQGADLALNLGRSLSVRRSDGATVPVPSGLILKQTHAGQKDDWSTVVDVPESFRRLTVTFRTSGTITDASTGKVLQYTRADKDNQRTMNLEPQTEYR